MMQPHRPISCLLLLLALLAALSLAGCGKQTETADQEESTSEELLPAEEPTEEAELPEEESTEEPAEEEEPESVQTEPSSTSSGKTTTSSSSSSTMTIDPATGKDQYQTSPVPAGKPEPVEPQETEVTSTTLTCTLSISCATILDNLDELDEAKVDLVPDDGWILEPTTVTFYEGESVFNVLQRTCKENKIHMEFENTPLYNSAYIEGIGNLYEFDCGDQSGWMYAVNGWFPNYGCSRYALENGDVIQWVYTCDLGADVGGSADQRDLT
jgi:hypothetical protein